MMPLLLALLQVAPPAPDIQLQATVDVESMTIEQRGNARLEVHASPDAGSRVKVEAPKANGAKKLKDFRVTVDAQARIGDAGGPENPPQATDAQPPR